MGPPGIKGVCRCKTCSKVHLRNGELGGAAGSSGGVADAEGPDMLVSKPRGERTSLATTEGVEGEEAGEAARTGLMEKSGWIRAAESTS